MFRSQIHFILIAPWITFLNISFCCHHYYMAIWLWLYDQAYLVKMVIFYACLDLDFVLTHEQAKRQLSNACFFFKQPLHAFPWVPLLGALYNHHDALEPMPISMATSVFCSVKTVTSLTTYSTEFSRAKAVSSGKETWADATVSDRTSFFKEESLLTS